MLTEKEIIDFIFSSHDAPRLVEEAMKRMEIELKKRKNFYNKIDKPNQKIKENQYHYNKSR